MILQEEKGKHRIILVAGSGASIKLVPEYLFSSLFVISINWTFKYIPKTDICFVSDYKKDYFITLKNIKKYPDVILTKYDFDFTSASEISKDLSKICVSNLSSLKALDLAYKLDPEIILMAGIDFRGQTDIGINYDDPEVDDLLNQETELTVKAIEKIRNEGIKVFNISPISRLKQDIIAEELEKICHY